MKFSGKMYFTISQKKTGFHPLFRRCIFRKTTGGVNLTQPPPLPPPLPPPWHFRVKVMSFLRDLVLVKSLIAISKQDTLILISLSEANK